jgi:hypothetical protein
MSFWHDQQSNVQRQISELEQKIAGLQSSGVSEKSTDRALAIDRATIELLKQQADFIEQKIAAETRGHNPNFDLAKVCYRAAGHTSDAALAESLRQLGAILAKPR